MATTVAIDLAPVQIGIAETTILTVPANHEYNIPTIRFCNTDNNPRNLTIYCYPSGGGPGGAGNTEYKSLSVGAGTTFEYGPIVLAAGRTVSALADQANKITASVHGWDTA